MKPKSVNRDEGKRVRMLTFPVMMLFCIVALANDPGDRPPADSQLAFVRDDQIWLVNADGTGLVQLTNTGAGVTNRDPAWSHDGQRLAFAMVDSGDDWNRPSDIYIMDADGSNVVQLTHGGHNVEPAWSPDGRMIAFTGYTGLSGFVGVFVINVDVDGSQESRVLHDYPGYDAQPAWSPDGRTITFTSDYRAYDFLFDLYAMNADGSEVRPILEGPFFWSDGLTFYFQSAWSPDGQSIGIVVCPYGYDDCYTNGSAIAVANADGSGLRVIAQAGSYASPTWSPDGHWIAYGSSRCRTCQSSIRFVQVDSRTEGLIVDNGHSPAWRPEPGTAIDAGYSGAWYNPETPGQGLLIDIEPTDQFIFLAWFTYTGPASDTPGQQHWYTAQGHYSGATADLELNETLGGRFDNPKETSTKPVGRIALSFTDCNQALLSYEIDADGREGTASLQRVIPGSADECEQKNAELPGTPSANINGGMDGAWFNENTPGQGFLIDAHPDPDGGNLIFAAWCTYGEDTASGQRWLTALGNFEGSSAAIDVYETTGGSFDDPQSVNSDRIGTMTLDFQDCDSALLTYSLPEEVLGNSIAISRAFPGAQVLCENLAGAD